MLLGYIDVNYPNILKFGENRFPPLALVAPRLGSKTPQFDMGGGDITVPQGLEGCPMDMFSHIP